MMRAEFGVVFGWLDGGRADQPRSAVSRAIDENHRFCLRNFFDHLGRPLVIAKHTHAKIVAPPFFGPLRKKRPDAVILAQRIPTSEDETSGRKSHAFIVLSE